MSAASNPGGFGPDVDIPIDTTPRIAELRLMLEDPTTCQQQIPNILAVLTEYEAGRTPEFIYQDGRPICIRDVDLNRPAWVEWIRLSSYPSTGLFNPPAGFPIAFESSPVSAGDDSNCKWDYLAPGIVSGGAPVEPKWFPAGGAVVSRDRSDTTPSTGVHSTFGDGPAHNFLPCNSPAGFPGDSLRGTQDSSHPKSWPGSLI
ncbi:hypothetical protein TWF569_008495 [Orbilia oligospora]|uniref:Uncharacterized protein n=1 Tax=Orbilia oligospora TaxID=2813651 RepID=A0A7C8JU14_ORBOL|nr:hypothetical protein TWF102_001904 [Orbilia oligospora]KAF3107324.1 hypothetical protein TWF706_003017 [Orbilia oligospora]KAF3134275.1 hypothetical protein TWF594_008825 [Orbilia oligospora]KAF3139644.1 hypothetical protein TWF569_008495 [Orbilia oligospora]KAF3141691.1 hypothetical protein TWF703_001712 [Orbilia oligospora]